jgi:hypothetical protein
MVTREVDGKTYILIEQGDSNSDACDICAGSGSSLCGELGPKCLGEDGYGKSWKEVEDV